MQVLKYEKRNNIQLSLDDYTKIAKKIVYSYLKTNSSYMFMMKDDDLLTNVTTRLIWADSEWNGKGTLEGFRKTFCVYAIKSYIKNYKKHDKLEIMFDLPEKVKNKIELFDINEDLKDLLSKTNYERFYLRYFLGYKLKDIAEKHNVSKAAIQISIAKSLKKIRDKYEFS